MDLNKLDKNLVDALKGAMLNRAGARPEIEPLVADIGIESVPPAP